MRKPNSITALVEFALENHPEAQGDSSSLVESVGRWAVCSLKGIGQILIEAGLRCGKANCKPDEGVEDETLCFLGNLIEDLADITEICSDHRATSAKRWKEGVQ